jgi:hypothetical protein
VAAYQRVRATVVEDRLDDMIEIVDHPDLDPLDKRGGSTTSRAPAGRRPGTRARFLPQTPRQAPDPAGKPLRALTKERRSSIR